MRSFLVLILSLPFLMGACTESGGDSGRSSACSVLGLNERASYNKIINGTDCSDVDSPVVQVTVLFPGGEIGTCSGSLLTARAVLTAAHCFALQRYPFSSASVRVEGRDHAVASVVLHPEANVPQNDAAIVFLASPASAPTLPLALSDALEPGDPLSVFGYGIDDEQFPGVLRSGWMYVKGIDSQDIQAVFDDESANVCYGDSGGPALWTFRNRSGEEVTGIVGITSFGNTAGCSRGGSAFFANTQSVSISDFILSTVPGAGKV
jgi:secreted trypsin-like serine protease